MKKYFKRKNNKNWKLLLLYGLIFCVLLSLFLEKFNSKLKIYRRINQKEEWFVNCLNEFKRLDKKKRFSINDKDFYKCLDDNTSTTPFDTHYEYHQAWATRCLKKINPKKHVDISSRITFNVIVSAFIPIDFYDYRPAQIKNLSGLSCKKADLTNLHFESNSISSLSCMHTIEHIGLGRYNDKVDPDGDLKAIEELKRVLAPGGNLLLVVPVGKPRIQYNAHRIYSYDMIISYFDNFELVNYSLIPDNAMEVGIINNAGKKLTDNQKYGCGCFWFKKRTSPNN